MADANAIYLSPKPYYLLLINTLRIILSSLLFTTHYHSLFLFYFLFIFFSHILHFLMADANAMYHPSFIIYYSSTHYLFTYYFLINPFLFPPWMVDANFIFILVFTSSYFCFILRMQHGLFILSHFIYNVLPLLYTFSSFMFIPHCKYFLSCILFF